MPFAVWYRMCIYKLAASSGTAIINEVLQLSSFIQFSTLIDLLLINTLMPVAFQRTRG